MDSSKNAKRAILNIHKYLQNRSLINRNKIFLKHPPKFLDYKN